MRKHDNLNFHNNEQNQANFNKTTSKGYENMCSGKKCKNGRVLVGGKL